MPPELAAGVLDALNEVANGGTEPRRRPDGALELTGPRRLLREALLVAIDEAGEALSGRCTRLLRAGGQAGPVRAGVDELRGLLDLLESVERTG